ncbi:MAG: hypothetical protein U9R43_18350 [Thermodesulfobacteriota bacterium]|nr:hypothetical protein [Thermodesulfobacteriota bacterium]
MKIEIEVESPPEGYSIPKRELLSYPFGHKDTLLLIGKQWFKAKDGLMMDGGIRICCHKLPEINKEMEKKNHDNV